jgi:hypothetical protein
LRSDENRFDAARQKNSVVPLEFLRESATTTFGKYQKISKIVLPHLSGQTNLESIQSEAIGVITI